MKAFNIAESKLAERNYCKKQISMYIRLIALLIFTFFVVIVVSYACKIKVNKESSNINSQLKAVTQECDLLNKKMDVAKISSGEINWQKQLSNKSINRLKNLDVIIRNVPENVWLDKIESSDNDSTLLVDGKTISFEVISAFTEKLRQSNSFSDVRIANTQYGTTKNVTYIDFTLNLKLVQAEMNSSTQTMSPQAINLNGATK